MPRAVCNQEYFGTATHNISLAARFKGWREYGRNSGIRSLELFPWNQLLVTQISAAAYGHWNWFV